MNNAGMTSSNRDDWRTPFDMFRQFDSVFNFDSNSDINKLSRLWKWVRM